VFYKEEDSNDMLSPRATGRDAGVGCCGLACLQISWDGKPTIGKIAKQNVIREGVVTRYLRAMISLSSCVA
jgi:Ethanolamine utilization protein EutJ (predicted chaperonin)